MLPADPEELQSKAGSGIFQKESQAAAE